MPVPNFNQNVKRSSEIVICSAQILLFKLFTEWKKREIQESSSLLYTCCLDVTQHSLGVLCDSFFSEGSIA